MKLKQREGFCRRTIVEEGSFLNRTRTIALFESLRRIVSIMEGTETIRGKIEERW
jgi:hypothetical protein